MVSRSLCLQLFVMNSSEIFSGRVNIPTFTGTFFLVSISKTTQSEKLSAEPIGLLLLCRNFST